MAPAPRVRGIHAAITAGCFTFHQHELRGRLHLRAITTMHNALVTNGALQEGQSVLSRAPAPASA